jgi:hypothetical protein
LALLQAGAQALLVSAEMTVYFQIEILNLAFEHICVRFTQAREYTADYFFFGAMASGIGQVSV